MEGVNVGLMLSDHLLMVSIFWNAVMYWVPWMAPTCYCKKCEWVRVGLSPVRVVLDGSSAVGFMH